MTKRLGFLVLLATLFVASTPARGAQELARIAIGPSLGVLDGKAGFGGVIGAALAVNGNFYVGVESGYTRWNDQNQLGVPVLATATYYFVGDHTRPYFGIAAGPVFFKDNGVSSTTFQFEMRPGVGFDLGGTLLFFENKVGVLRGKLLIAPGIGVNFAF